VTRGDRGRRFGRPTGDRRAPNGNGNGHAAAGGLGNGWVDDAPPPLGEGGLPMRQPVAVGPGAGEAAAVPAPALVLTIPRVSPLRGSIAEGTLEVVVRPGGAAGTTMPAPTTARVIAPPEPASIAPIETDAEEPALPDELARDAAASAEAPTSPVEAGTGAVLQVRFLPAPQEQLVAAFGVLREVIHAHPGDTPVLLRIPAGGGREERMQLRRGVAYDAEFAAEVSRRLGPAAVELRLG
jgi:hypothetical protein